MTKPRTKAKTPAEKTQAETTKSAGTRPRAAVEATSASKPAPRRRSTAATPGKQQPTVRQAAGATVTDEDIRVRAYQLYLERNGAEDPAGDWLRAERELRAESKPVARPKSSSRARAQNQEARE